MTHPLLDRLRSATCDRTLQRSYPDEECGCPVEEWLVGGVDLTLHFEADGTMEVFADTGDWDLNFPLKATTMEAARAEAFAWVEALPTEPLFTALANKEAPNE